MGGNVLIPSVNTEIQIWETREETPKSAFYKIIN